MFFACRRMGEKLLAALHIVRKTTASQDHSARGSHLHCLALVLHHCAGNTVIFDHQLGDGGR